MCESICGGDRLAGNTRQPVSMHAPDRVIPATARRVSFRMKLLLCFVRMPTYRLGLGDCAGGGDIGVRAAPPEPVVPACELGMHCAEALLPLACSHCAMV